MENFWFLLAGIWTVLWVWAIFSHSADMTACGAFAVGCLAMARTYRKDNE
jgi:hypothetical protein